MSRPSKFAATNEPMTRDDAHALTIEIRRLRLAVEREHRLMLNGRDAAIAMGYSGKIFRKLVANGIIPATKLDDDLAPRYSVRALEKLIQERTNETQWER